jgi:hypothetical protein
MGELIMGPGKRTTGLDQSRIGGLTNLGEAGRTLLRKVHDMIMMGQLEIDFVLFRALITPFSFPKWHP